jgi:hypothetical protein
MDYEEEGIALQYYNLVNRLSGNERMRRSDMEIVKCLRKKLKNMAKYK